MSKIHYVIGDATTPIGTGARIIAHVCNDSGGWGRGFVLALSAKDKRPERAYRGAAHQGELNLGWVHMELFDPDGSGGIGLEDTDVFVANMIAQHGYITPATPVPLDYEALWSCLNEVGQEAYDMKATVHMPRIGCGLGGGTWTDVEEIIAATLLDVYGVDVYVYDLPTKDAIVDHHEMDEGDEGFQRGLRELAARSDSGADCA